MSFRRKTDPREAARILGEDRSSEDEIGFESRHSPPRKLNLSRYLDAMEKDQKDKDVSPPSNSKKRKMFFIDDDDGSATGPDDSDIDWPEEDPSADYREFKERKTLKRKAAAAETVRLRKQKQSRLAASSRIIGRKLPKKAKQESRDIGGFGAGTETDHTDAKETYLDEPTPEYIESRKKKLKKLHEAGLRYPPSYDDIEFSDDGEELEEKPVLHPDIKRQRPKKDILLKDTGGVIPAPIAQWLRKYQIVGVQFLHENFVRQTGCILGDDMGLGKTIQVIAFLTAAFGKTGTKRDAKIMRKVRRIGDDRWYPRILIVCPGTLMQNWQDELQKWGWWQADKYHGNANDKRGVLSAIKGGRSEIMITTYSTYRNAESEINTIDWDCVIADECHQIKSRNAEITKAMNKVNALCRIGLTGTAIQNKYEELWNLLNWARPGDYGSAQEWKQRISEPLRVGQSHDATHHQLAQARLKANELVETILLNVFLRRMKTLIADQLPKKSDRVVFCQLTDTQADAYRTFIESEPVEYIRRAREPCDCGSDLKRGWCCYQEIPGFGRWGNYMFPAMITLTKLANHVALLLPRSLDPPDKQAKDMEALQRAVPDAWPDLYDKRDSILNLSQREYCGKWSVLKRLLNFWHQNGDKVLVFSHSVRLLRLLKALFDVDGMKYNWSYLDGGMTLEDRSAAVADFNSNPQQFVFLISTKAGGVGLNITSANKVVVMDPNWNPAYDLQAQDRAYRIGQTRDVEVFRLVSSGTIEEIVYARQIYKQQQANIGYTASDERRYFKGVMDSSEKKGELFGLENLFSFDEEGYLLRDIVRKTNVAETRAGVRALDYVFEDEEEGEKEENFENVLADILDDDQGGKDSEKKMKRLAEQMLAKKRSDKRKVDAVNAILAKAGVQYTHENSEVIGPSKREAALSRRAIEVRNDRELGQKHVFLGSQSQSQSQHDAMYSEDEEGMPTSGSRARGGDEFKISYRYRPKEDVRCRQFCSMAKMMGYDDPTQFALVVEDMTQDERINMLESFYRSRRKQIAADFKDR